MLTLHHAPRRRRRARDRRERERETQRERKRDRGARARRRATATDASVPSHGRPRSDARDAFVPSLDYVLIVCDAFAYVLHIYVYDDVPSDPSDGSARRRARRPQTAGAPRYE